MSRDDIPTGCALAAFLLWLVGIVVGVAFWVLLIDVLWKVAHRL